MVEALVGRTAPTPNGHSGRNLGLREHKKGGRKFEGVALSLAIESPASKNLGVHLGEEGLPCPTLEISRDHLPASHNPGEETETRRSKRHTKATQLGQD